MEDFKQEAKELVEKMDLLEKVSQLRYDAPPIKRLKFLETHVGEEVMRLMVKIHI